MSKPRDDVMYAAALRADDGLWLLARIRRSKSGDVYYLMPRDDPDWNSHASYHKNGASHVRSYHWKNVPSQRQKPDASFQGVETVLSEAFNAGDVLHHRTPCDAEEFDQVFEIPIDKFPPDEHHTLAVDLVAPGGSAAPGPWKEMVIQKSFQDAVPWILVTVWRGLAF